MRATGKQLHFEDRSPISAQLETWVDRMINLRASAFIFTF